MALSMAQKEEIKEHIRKAPFRLEDKSVTAVKGSHSIRDIKEFYAKIEHNPYFNWLSKSELSELKKHGAGLHSTLNKQEQYRESVQHQIKDALSEQIKDSLSEQNKEVDDDEQNNETPHL